VHYLVFCGACAWCRSGHEQFCASGEMIGKHRDGGFAERLVVPAPSVVALPEEVPFEHGAVLMCSSATALHALRKGRLAAGERVAVFGAGGLGISAVQLARHLGAREVFAVDVRPEKLRVAAALGAVPVDAGAAEPVARLRELTAGAGVDVALEMAGLALTAGQGLRSLGRLGRLVLVGLCDQPFAIRAYSDLLGNEAEIIGCSDHLLGDVTTVLDLARQGRLDLSGVVARTVPLEAGAVNAALRDLRAHQGPVRTVIVP
jgi:propanol-preferring alcohol dehydrogenase